MKNQSSALFTLFFVFFFSIPSFAQNNIVGNWILEEDDEVANFNFSDNGFVQLTMQGDTLGGEIFMLEGVPACMKYELNTTVFPNQIDFIITILGANLEIARMPGIYEFDKKKLKLAIDFEGETRPEIFSGEDFVTLTKVK